MAEAGSYGGTAPTHDTTIKLTRQRPVPNSILDLYADVTSSRDIPTGYRPGDLKTPHRSLSHHGVSGHNEQLGYAHQGLSDDVLRFVDNRVEMRLALQAFRVQFVDILSAGRPRRKPAVLRHDFQSSD